MSPFSFSVCNCQPTHATVPLLAPSTHGMEGKLPPFFTTCTLGCLELSPFPLIVYSCLVGNAQPVPLDVHGRAASRRTRQHGLEVVSLHLVNTGSGGAAFSLLNRSGMSDVTCRLYRIYLITHWGRVCKVLKNLIGEPSAFTSRASSSTDPVSVSNRPCILAHCLSSNSRQETWILQLRVMCTHRIQVTSWERDGVQHSGWGDNSSGIKNTTLARITPSRHS